MAEPARIISDDEILKNEFGPDFIELLDSDPPNAIQRLINRILQRGQVLTLENTIIMINTLGIESVTRRRQIAYLVGLFSVAEEIGIGLAALIQLIENGALNDILPNTDIITALTTCALGNCEGLNSYARLSAILVDAAKQAITEVTGTVRNTFANEDGSTLHPYYAGRLIGQIITLGLPTRNSTLALRQIRITGLRNIVSKLDNTSALTLVDDAGVLTARNADNIIITQGDEAVEGFVEVVRKADDLNIDIDDALIDSWKKVDDLGDNAFDQLRKDPDFLKKFDDVVKNDKLNSHTFKGDVTSTVGADGITRHKVTGIHSNKAFADGTARIKPGTEVTDLGDGFYKAKVEKQIDGFVNDQGTNWKVKTDKSTFFPDAWSTEKIQAEIAHAFKNKIPDGGNKFHGFTTGDKKITMFLDEAGNIKTAFPNL